MTQAKLEHKLNACEANKEKADDITDKLKAMHKRDYNKIRYKLWVEATVSGKHNSEGDPPIPRYYLE